MSLKKIKHTLDKVNDMQSLCEPLFYQTPITIVNYIQLDKRSNAACYLCDNYDWLNNYLKSDFYKVGAFENNKAFWHQPYVLWDSLSDSDPIVTMSKDMFNINTGITLVNNTEHHVHVFNFGTDQKNHHHKLLDLMPRLDVFRHEFFDKTKKLRKENALLSLNIERPENILYEESKRKRLYLGPKFDYNYLTKTELDVASYLSKGLNTVEIAGLMQASHRTIEKHIENIKRKLGCHTLFEMGFVLSQFITTQ